MSDEVCSCCGYEKPVDGLLNYPEGSLCVICRSTFATITGEDISPVLKTVAWIGNRLRQDVGKFDQAEKNEEE